MFIGGRKEDGKREELSGQGVQLLRSQDTECCIGCREIPGDSVLENHKSFSLRETFLISKMNACFLDIKDSGLIDLIPSIIIWQCPDSDSYNL